MGDLTMENARKSLAEAVATRGESPEQTNLSLAEAAFAYMDRTRRGRVTVTDVWQLLGRGSRHVPIEGIQALFTDLRLTFGLSGDNESCIDFRGVAFLVLPRLRGGAFAALRAIPGGESTATVVRTKLATLAEFGASTARGARGRAFFKKEPMAWPGDHQQDALAAYPGAEKRLLELVELGAETAPEVAKLREALLSRSPTAGDGSVKGRLATWLWLRLLGRHVDALAVRYEDLQQLFREHGLWHRDSVGALELLWLRIS